MMIAAGFFAGFFFCILCLWAVVKLVQENQRLEHADKVERNQRTYLGGREREMPGPAKTGAAHGEVTIGTKTASSLPNGPQVGSSARP